KVWITQKHLACLLSCGDDQRSLVLESGHDIAHAIAGPRAGMQVHEDGFLRGLRESIGHGNDRGLLQTENILKIFWEILEKGLLRGTRVSENCRQAQLAQEVVRSLPNGHLSFALPISCRLQNFGLTVLAHIQISLCNVRLCRVRSSLSK